MTTPADTDHLSSPDEPLYPRRPQPTPANSTADVTSLSPRGVVVRERGGTPFRQIFWSRNGAPANIVGHRWNANTEASRQITSYSLGWPSISLFSGPNCPQTRNLASKISKNFPGVIPPDLLSGRGDPLSHRPQHGYTPCTGGGSSPVAGT